MKKHFGLAILIATFLVGTAYADGDENGERKHKKGQGYEQEVEGERSTKSKGRPDDPGAHGRANAAQKQAENKGKGSEKHSGEEIEAPEVDEVEEDDPGFFERIFGGNRNKKESEERDRDRDDDEIEDEVDLEDEDESTEEKKADREPKAKKEKKGKGKEK